MKKKIVLKIMLTLMLIGMFTLMFNVQPVKAEPALVSILHSLGFTNIAQSTTETFVPGTYEVTLFAEFAAYHASNTLSWYTVGTSSYTILYSGSEGNFGYINPSILKTFITNEQFGLSFHSPEARYFTETARNPDGIKHALAFTNLDDPAMFLLGFENLYGGGDRDYQDMVISLELIKPAAVEASLEINPDTLNCKSQGQWVTAYIQLPEEYNPEEIDSTTILLNETIQLILDPKYDFVTNSSKYIVDHDGDAILERMVKFDRAEVASWVFDDLGIQYGDITLTMTGELFDGTPFEGTVIIRVLFPGDVDDDGYVGSADAGVLNGAYGTSMEDPLYVLSADFDEDGYIGSADAGILNGNYGKIAT